MTMRATEEVRALVISEVRKRAPLSLVASKVGCDINSLWRHFKQDIAAAREHMLPKGAPGTYKITGRGGARPGAGRPKKPRPIVEAKQSAVAIKGQWGGPRPNSGGARPGAGRPKGPGNTATEAALFELRSALIAAECDVASLIYEYGALRNSEDTKNSLAYARRLLESSMTQGVDIPEKLVEAKLLQMQLKRLAKALIRGQSHGEST